MKQTGTPTGIHEMNMRVAARGLLIMLVIIGHNKLFQRNFYYSGYILIYSFHVSAFFLLATMSQPRRMTRRVMAGMLLRFYKPFLIFTLIYGLIYFPFYLEIPENTAAKWIATITSAAILASNPFLDKATGLKLLWFLPSFMTFCLLYNLYADIPSAARRAVWAIAALAHAMVATLPSTVLSFMPFGAAIAIFMFFPSLAFAMVRPLLANRYGNTIAITGFALCSALIVDLRVELILSDFQMPGMSSPLILALCDMQIVLGGLTCVIVARILMRSRMILWIGSRSMQIYLLHAPFNVAISALATRILPWPLAMCLTVLATLIATAVAARLIEASPAGPLIFSVPRKSLPSLRDCKSMFMSISPWASA